MNAGKQKPRWAQIAAGLMKVRGLRYDDIRDAMGVTTRGAVGHYFTGNREPSIEQLAALAKLLGVSTSHLIGEVPLSPDPQENEEIERLLQEIDPEDKPMLLRMLRAAAKRNGSNS